VIVAHLSDLHLGFRAYGRAERGVDVRERDVAAAFERASQEVVKARPDVVVIAGDVFDRPDPPAGAVVALARGLEVLRAALPEAPVLLVAGPRDTPRRQGDPGALAAFDTFPNVEAATGLMRSILIERMDLHVCLVPYRALTRHPPALPEPDPRKRWNLLVLHADEGHRGAGVHVDPADWSYVALGGEHRRRKITDKVRYPGSLERVALDPWGEAADEKGFLVVDLDSGRTEFRAVPGRPVVALAPVKVGHGDPQRLLRRVREVTGEIPGGMDGKIVRLRLEGAAPEDLLALQGEPLRELRAKALHLAVEAGRELWAPADAWLPLEAPRLLREAVTAELERDGLLDDETSVLLRDGIPDDAPAPQQPLGVLDALDGEVTGLGRVSTSIPSGLTAFLGGGGRARRAVAELLTRRGRGDETGALVDLWVGTESETLEGAVRRATEAVAEARGLSVVGAALDRLGASVQEPVPAPSETPASEPHDRERGAIRVDPEQVAAELRAADRELTASRADVAETDGDLEVATMDWHRERQDAETTLNAYRDRARELRNRIRRMESAGPEAPCPTCGRVLESHYEDVLTRLEEQWEEVVQDGSWWRSRWEQLELKPDTLQELEGRSLRLHAALEAGSERVEILKARLREPDGGTSPPTPPVDGPQGAVVAALRRVHRARMVRARDMLLQRASRFACRITGGRILAITRDDEEELVRLQGGEGVLSPMSEEDVAAGKIAIRLAAASLVAGRGRVLASLPIEGPFDRLDEEARIRTVVLMRSLLREIPRFVLFTKGEVVDARPELFDYVLEVREESAATGPTLRPTEAGPGRIAVLVPMRTKPGRVASG
jgi:DNA repair exonuclease SbcCD nuclease subunit